MCFDATASISSGLAIGAVGVATMPLVREPRERPFAALVFVFGVHQLLEGMVWLRLDDGHSATIHDPAVAAWLLIAWTLLPVWVPLAVARFEPDAARRRAMHGLAVLGGLVGVGLFVVGWSNSTAVTIDQHHLVYSLGLSPWIAGVPYVAATCGALLLSSHRFVRRFGGALPRRWR